MSQYLLAVHAVDGDAPLEPEVIEQMHADVAAFNAEVRTAGAWVFAGGLYPPDQATVVRSQDGRVTTTDGLFARSKQRLSGMWIIEAPDMDAAVAWAAKGAAACRGPVEVRPFGE